MDYNFYSDTFFLRTQIYHFRTAQSPYNAFPTSPNCYSLCNAIPHSIELKQDWSAPISQILETRRRFNLLCILVWFQFIIRGRFYHSPTHNFDIVICQCISVYWISHKEILKWNVSKWALPYLAMHIIRFDGIISSIVSKQKRLNIGIFIWQRMTFQTTTDRNSFLYYVGLNFPSKMSGI